MIQLLKKIAKSKRKKSAAIKNIPPKSEWHLPKEEWQGTQSRLSNDFNFSVSVCQILTTDRLVNIFTTIVSFSYKLFEEWSGL